MPYYATGEPDPVYERIHTDEPIVAWRCWKVVHVHAHASEVLLRSCSQGDIWMPGQPMKTSSTIPPIAPYMTQQGFHAFHTREQAVTYCDALRMVYGQVTLWGRVIECDDESGQTVLWRGEYAYPRYLYVPRYLFENESLDVAASLRRSYGCEAEYV